MCIRDSYAALAMDNNVNGLDIARLTASYTFGDLFLGAMLQQAKDADINNGKGLKDNVKGAIGAVLNDFSNTFVAEDQNSVLVSAKWTIDQWTINTLYIQSSYENATDEVNNNAISIGFDYRINKRTKLHSYYSVLTVDKNRAIGLMDDYQYQALGVIGMEYKFWTRE